MKEIYTQLKNKYASMAAPVKASLWFTVCSVINKGIALLTTPIMTRILTQEQYGTYAVYQSWLSIITIFASLNLFQSAFTKGLVKYEEDQKGLESALLSLSSLITLVLFAIFLLSPSFWSKLFHLPPLLIGTIFVEIFFVTAYEFWAAEQRFDYKYKLLVALSILMSAGSVILGIVAILHTEHKVEARIFANLFMRCSIGLILFVTILIKGKKIYSTKYWKYALIFNIPLIPHFLSHFVLNQSDRIMISNMVGKEEAAIYSIAYSISMMMMLITNAVNQSFTPYSYKKIKENDTKPISSSANAIFFLVCLLCALTMAFGPEIIAVFAGREYADAIWIIPPVASSVFFIFVYSMFVNLEFYFKKTAGISIASVGCAVLNLGLNYLFIRLFGYIAAGYTTLISYIALAFVHYLFYRRILRQNYGPGTKIYNVKIILLCAMIVLLTMGIMLVSYQFLWLRIAVIAVVIGIAWLKRKRLLQVLKTDRE